MEYKVLISPRALEELGAALEYYSEIPVVMNAFISAYEISLNTLSFKPFL